MAGRRLGFSVPKRGRGSAENEDAFEIVPDRGAVAVADGATDASFSKAWARLLVDSFALWPIDTAAGPEAVVQWLDRPQGMWQRMLAGRPLPWHAQHKVERGAFAAFVGAEIRPDGDAVTWSALGVGDCCLFVVEGDRLTTSFPIDDPAAFGSSPFLLGSKAEANLSLAAHLKHARGKAARGSTFLLMSDALAHWFLTAARAEVRPWEAALALDGQAAFADWVAQLRDDRVLRNDDTTLVIWET